MAKAAEVYTRLKSRVLGPKVEALQKVNKVGAEKEQADGEKMEEQPGEQAPRELAEDEPSTGEGCLHGQAGTVPCFSPESLPAPTPLWGTWPRVFQLHWVLAVLWATAPTCACTARKRDHIWVGRVLTRGKLCAHDDPLSP